MDLRQIQYFAALYEEHNITKAAHRLNVVPPALSTQIIALKSRTDFRESSRILAIETIRV